MKKLFFLGLLIVACNNEQLGDDMERDFVFHFRVKDIPSGIQATLHTDSAYSIGDTIRMGVNTAVVLFTKPVTPLYHLYPLGPDSIVVWDNNGELGRCSYQDTIINILP